MNRPTLLLMMVLLLLLGAGCGNRPDFSSGKGTFTDSRDKHEYQWIRIGDQVWMAENLAWLPSVSSSSEMTYGPHYYVYGYPGAVAGEAAATVNFATYGVLYSWEAAKTACPKGWRLPTDEDWKILETSQGMNPVEADKDYSWRKSASVGNKLKSATGWEGNGNQD